MYSFMIHFALLGARPLVEEDELQLWSRGEERIWWQSNGPLKDAEKGSLRGEGYETPGMAEARATELLGAMRLAFLRAGIATDFMERRSFLTLAEHVLEAAAEKMPPGFRLQNQRGGILVHPSDEQPLFMSMSAQGEVHAPAARIVQEFEAALAGTIQNPRAMLAFDMYSSATRMPTTDSSLLGMVSAVEALVEPQPVAPEERAVLDSLVELVESSELPTTQRQSLANRVRGLKKESIRKAARRLVQRLPGEYAEMTPVRFFDRVYELRSRLTHGDNPPSWIEVEDVQSDLGRFVRELIELEFTDPIDP